jgi:hypothetical protein
MLEVLPLMFHCYVRQSFLIPDLNLVELIYSVYPKVSGLSQ